MIPRTTVFIILSWQEESRSGMANSRVLYQKERKVYTPTNYPERLPCSNPCCQTGGFDIGDRISALLISGQYEEQNSLICDNAVHPDRTERCLHTIRYSITCVYPFQRETPDRTLKQVFPHLGQL